MNNGRNIIIIRPTDRTSDRIRALSYFGQFDQITARNMHETMEFKTIKIKQKHLRIALVYALANYFKECDFIEIL